MTRTKGKKHRYQAYLQLYGPKGEPPHARQVGDTAVTPARARYAGALRP